MSKSDIEIWKQLLDNGEKVICFETKPGGPHTKPLPKKEIFTSPKERKTEKLVNDLKKKVEILDRKLTSTTRTLNQIKKEINILKNKKPQIQKAYKE